MPIFYDAELAIKFGRYMEQKLREFGDRRHLLTQICDQPQKACDMLKVISTISPELHTIAIDPVIEDGNVVEQQTIEFDEAIEQLQEVLSVEGKSSDGDGYSPDDSKT